MTDETVFTWLVERGQPEGQVPTVWWTGSGWTEDANKADRFSREAAEAVIEAKFTPPASRGGPSARAVEHGFVPPMTDETPAPLTTEEERLLRFSRSIGGMVVGWEPAPTVDRLLATLDATRARSVPDDRLRAALDKHGWYVADVVTTAHIESSEWVPALRDALASDATPSTGLDVERLAEALVVAFRSERAPIGGRGDGWPAYWERGLPATVLNVDLLALAIAREYAALSASPTETP